MAKGAAKLPRRDDLPMVKVSRLRATGAITLESTSVVVAFGDGDDALKREVKVTHRMFPVRGKHGRRGSWSLFICPSCSRRAQVLRLYDGRVVCIRCDGLLQRQQMGDKSGRIARLREKLYGGQFLRDRRKRLEASLRMALIAERRRKARLAGHHGRSEKTTER